jgi:phosphate transport system permease protein
MAASIQTDDVNQVTAHTAPQAPFARRASPLGDLVFAGMAGGAALLTSLMLAGIIVSLIVGAWPAIQNSGLSFLTTAEWDPVKEKFGGLAMIDVASVP